MLTKIYNSNKTILSFQKKNKKKKERKHQIGKWEGLLKDYLTLNTGEIAAENSDLPSQE